MTKFCSRCGKRRPRIGKLRCDPCAEASRLWEANKKINVPAGMCKKCCKREAIAGFRQCESCRKSQAKRMNAWRAKRPEEERKRLRDWNRARRLKVINHYGGRCACCGERAIEFLAIDHIAGGGDRHRIEVGGGGAKMVNWIVNNNLPLGFRILCHNCNQSIGFYGYCPHQRLAVVAA